MFSLNHTSYILLPSLFFFGTLEVDKNDTLIYFATVIIFKISFVVFFLIL